MYEQIDSMLPQNSGQGVVMPDFEPLQNFAGVLFLGENPGDSDVQSNQHFVGPYSRIFNDELLPNSNLKREQIYLTNVTKFNLPANRDPTDSEIASCKELTIAEIAYIKPKIIVAMGKYAAEFFLGNGIKITKIHGQFFRFKMFANLEFDLLITVHPAAANHNPSYLNSIRADFELLKEYLEDKNNVKILEIPKQEKINQSTELF